MFVEEHRATELETARDQDENHCHSHAPTLLGWEESKSNREGKRGGDQPYPKRPGRAPLRLSGRFWRLRGRNVSHKIIMTECMNSVRLDSQEGDMRRRHERVGVSPLLDAPKRADTYWDAEVSPFVRSSSTSDGSKQLVRS